MQTHDRAADETRTFSYDEVADIAFWLMIECVICAMQAQEEHGPGDHPEIMAALGGAGTNFSMFMRALETGIKQLLDEREALKNLIAREGNQGEQPA